MKFQENLKNRIKKKVKQLDIKSITDKLVVELNLEFSERIKKGNAIFD